MSAAALETLADAMVPEPMRVRQVRRETRDTCTLTLDAARAGGAGFAPGQFNMLYVFGVGEVAISMSGDPADERLVHTVRSVGAVTQALCAMRPDDRLGVRGPYGRPWPVDEARGADLLFIAGGLGLAPIRPAIYHVLRRRAEFGAVALLVGGRTPDDLLYREELAGWARRDDLQVLVTVDRAETEWTGRVGVVTALVAAAGFDPRRTTAFVCGPEVMMHFAARELERHGVGDRQVYLSMERNMKCAVGWCGHCQFGPHFICKDGPVLRLDRVRPLLSVREV